MAEEKLIEGVRLILRNWSILSLAVENGLGGENSVEKALWLEEVVFEELRSNGHEMYQDDVEIYLEEILGAEFSLVLSEEVSVKRVSELLLKLYQSLLAGDESVLLELRRRFSIETEYKNCGKDYNDSSEDDNEDEKSDDDMGSGDDMGNGDDMGDDRNNHSMDDDSQRRNDIDKGAALNHTENKHVIRPTFKHKFRPSIACALIKQILSEKLTGVSYQQEMCGQLCKEIADEVKSKLKDLGLDRYKYVVNVVIGEQRGQGVRMNYRGFWDIDTDNSAQELFTNDSIFCSVVAYGIFFY